MEFQAIWDTFSKIQKKDLPIAPKGTLKLDYLSWAKALHMAIDHFPDLTFDCNKEQIYEDGTMMVFASVTIGGHTREMWLPVMDHKNNSIVSPSSRQISDNKMRCLVKCFALFGLGLNVYAGEDLKYLEEGEEPTQEELQERDVMTAINKTWQEEVAESSDIEIINVDGNTDKLFEDMAQTINQLILEQKDFKDVVDYWLTSISAEQEPGAYNFLDIKSMNKKIYDGIVEHRDLQLRHYLKGISDKKELQKLITVECKSVLNALKKQSADDYKEIMAIATERKTQLQGES